MFSNRKGVKKTMKKCISLLLIASMCLSVGGALAEDQSAVLRSLLEEADFIVQQGRFYELDTVKAASEGKLMSCFGNNAGSAYTVFDLPDAPDQSVPNPSFPPANWQFKLRQDEAIVLITPLPPECVYYSFINYIMFTEQKADRDYSASKGYFGIGDETTGLYHPVFGSIGDSVNMQTINHSGDSAYGSEAVIVISANQSVTEQVLAQLKAAGYDESMINLMPIPAGTYRMGLEKGDDTFCFLGRVSQAKDKQAYQDYLAALQDESVLYRVTPKTGQEAAPYAYPEVTARGTGEHELASVTGAVEHLDEIRDALIAQYADEYDYEELDSQIAVPEGSVAYVTDTNAQGDNRDAAYLMTGDFTLNSDEDFIVVYGVNHTTSGKAMYSNAILYGRPMLNGVVSVYDSLFEGSADAYLEEGCEDADKYYVYKMAREKTDDYTAQIEYSTGNERGKYYGIDNGGTMLLAFRAYLDRNGVGPSYYELVYDRAIVFHKK